MHSLYARRRFSNAREGFARCGYLEGSFIKKVDRLAIKRERAVAEGFRFFVVDEPHHDKLAVLVNGVLVASFVNNSNFRYERFFLEHGVIQ